MKKYFILVCIIILSTITNAYAQDGCNEDYDICYHESHEWTKTDTALLITANVLSYIDYKTTRYMPKDEYYESDPIVASLAGSHPDKKKLDIICPLSMIAASVTAYYMPNPYRDMFLSGWIGLEGGIVYNEGRIGLSIKLSHLF